MLDAVRRRFIDHLQNVRVLAVDLVVRSGHTLKRKMGEAGASVEILRSGP